jgi:hypothetical protein
MNGNLQAQLETMPQLAGRHTEMVKITTDAEDLENRQALLKADLQELNRQRRDLVKKGEDRRSRIGAILKAEHGFTSERLLEFGLKPRRIRSRGKKTAEGPGTTPAPTSPATK